jgi:hypothetical protein
MLIVERNDDEGRWVPESALEKRLADREDHGYPF